MVNTASVLDPFSTKPRETAKVNPHDQLGGSMELPNLDFEVETPLKNMASGVGSILQEAFSLGQEIAGIQPENKKFSKGSIEFNMQNQLDPETQAAIAETERITQERKEELDAATEAERIVQESQQARSEFIVGEELRFEVAGMSDEELAVQGDYKNTSFKNRLSLRSIANKMWVLMKRVASVMTAKKQEKYSFFEAKKGRINYFMQQNMAGERAGGQHVMSAVG